jgi:flagellar hook-associated protein 2
MASNISSMINNRLRISGISSGIDTEGMIGKLMAVERMKVDKVKQDRTLLEWKRDKYRDITNLLRAFKDEYFNYLNPATNIRSISSLSAFKTTYNASDTSSAITATAGANAKAGTYTITDIITAKTAKAEGSSLSGSMVASDIPVLGINSASDNNKIAVKLNGISKEIIVSDNPASVNALVADLQAKIDAAFGSGKVTVGKDASDKLTFNTSNTNTLSIGYAYNSGSTKIFNTNMSAGITLSSYDNKFKLTYDNDTSDAVAGITKEIVLPTGNYANTDAMAAALQNILDDGALGFGPGKIRVLNVNDKIVLKSIGTSGSAAGVLSSADVSGGATVDATNKDLSVTIDGVTRNITLTEKVYTRKELLTEIQAKLDSTFGAGKTMVSLDGSNQLRFEGIASSAAISIAAKENGGLDDLKLADAYISNKVNMSANLGDYGGYLATPLSTPDTDGDGYDIEFTINGKEFQFNSADTSLSEIISTVNSDATANVKMQYDELNDKLRVESKDIGATAKVQIASTDGNLMGILGFDGVNVTGSDASMKLDDGTGIQTITRTTNNFTLNGIVFDLKEDSAGPIQTVIAGNPDKTFDLVVKFIGKYNEIINKLNSTVAEKRPRSGGDTGSYYLPLTDEQKEAMKDSDVEKWEQKAHTGLLRNDGIIGKIASDMRLGMSDMISGMTDSLYSIGIKTGTYEQKGMMVIDEAKLKEAIKNTPDKVLDIFSKESSTKYSPDLNAADRATRYSENGIASRLYDILEDNIRTTRSISGRKGVLLEKAGVEGDLSEFKNLLNEQITSKDDLIDRLMDKLITKENYYYAKFSAMESYMNQMNSQSSWLTQQLGGSQ